MTKRFLILLFAIVIVACSKDDDQTQQTTPICNPPENITINNITSANAELQWDESSNANSYLIEYGISGFSLGSGETIITSETSIILLGLEGNTTYEVYITTICSSSNESMTSDPISFTTTIANVIAEFLPNLSDLNLYQGNLSNLTPSSKTFEYNLNTPLFTDYAHKQRLIALPEGTTMTYVDDLLPEFPDNTVISKTFFYYNNEQDESQGKTIIETRILIKKNGIWETGNYKWNEAQTDATLDNTTSTTSITYTDQSGAIQNVNYVIPSNNDCATCHGNNTTITPIGPKLRNLKRDNQIQALIDENFISNLTDASEVSALPNWENTSLSLEERARAYFDVNCAHCHSSGGSCEDQSLLRLRYETRFNETNIYESSTAIAYRMSFYQDGLSMPFIGTTMVHDEGYALISDYIDSL
ncbi:fibronectin type III domain-containing protein [Mangrovimonas cancribranchiae]|uniref:Fibronectin type III domain-containing protein n=1 Tax=Mangrovimonas cancribranchiae TaxID=3080055 RepID=A0AAU6NY72_9FLAO